MIDGCCDTPWMVLIAYIGFGDKQLLYYLHWTNRKTVILSGFDCGVCATGVYRIPIALWHVLLAPQDGKNCKHCA
eukprot:6436627-Amphidinium_carterae.1